MASSDLARLVVKLEAETGRYSTQLEKANRQLSRFQRDQQGFLKKIEGGFTSLTRRVGGFISVYGTLRSLTGSIQLGDDLAKFAAKSGLAAEAASQLAHAAKMADVDLTQLGTAFKTMQVAISTAASGGKEATEALQALGLSIEQIRALRPDEQFETMADRISKLQDPADRTRAAVVLFGRAGADLLPMFEQGAAGIRKARQEGIEMGKSFSAIDLAKFQEADTAIKGMTASIESAKMAAASMAAGPIAELADKIAVAFGGGSEFTKMQVRIRDLKRELESGWGLYLNFGYIDGAPVVMGPDKISEWIERLTQQAERLKNIGTMITSPSRGSLLGSGASPGFRPSAKGGTDDAMRPGMALAAAEENMRRYTDAIKSTRTEIEAASAAYAAFKDEQDLLFEGGIIKAETYNARLAEFLENAIPDVKVTAEKMQAVTTQFDNVTVAAQAAAANIQGAFANFFIDFDNGIKGLAESFLKTLQQMVANLAASQLMSFIGGGLSKSSNGFLASIGSAFLVPGRASGGPVSAGMPYMVGEKGPEMFVPGMSGSIVPNGGMVPFAPSYNFHIDARSDRAAVRQDMIVIAAEASRRGLEQFRDYLSRGGR